MAVRLDKKKCIECRICYERCPEGSYGLDENGKVYVRYPEECWLCGSCEMDCPVDAIQVVYEANSRPMFVGKAVAGK